DVKGFKFAFPVSGNDLDSIRFNEADRDERATLRSVLISPEKYRAIFAMQPNTDIGVYSRDRPGLFLGRFDRNAINDVDFAFHVGENQRNCASWAKAFERARLEDPKDQKLEDGWRESVTAGISTVYVRDPSAGVAPGKIPALYCNEQHYCGSSICVAPTLS